MDINDLYSYIRQNTTDDYNILKNKIDDFSHEGLEPIRIYNIISWNVAFVPSSISLPNLKIIHYSYFLFVTDANILHFFNPPRSGHSRQ